ncbi:MAG TPA: helix-turn-helix domain-containing protein [Labilithrix sp.]|jgi:AcrR family transcriptional regulator
MKTRLPEGGILAAAAGVFGRLGYAATRVEDILGAAGIARRTFYKRFKSKDEVLAAVYELATSELLRAVRDAGRGSGDRLTAIRGGLDVYLDYHVDNGPLVRVLTEQAMRAGSPLHTARERFRRDLVRLLDEAVREDLGEKNDPLLYLALLSALEGVSLELLGKSGGKREVERARAVMHTILDRVLAPAS